MNILLIMADQFAAHALARSRSTDAHFKTPNLDRLASVSTVFTQAYTPPDPSLFVAASDGVDTMGGVIAAQTGTIQAGYVASSGAMLVEFATPDETLAAVRNGEADAVLADASYLQPIADADENLMVVGDPVALGGGVGMGLRESDAELKGKFDAAIQSMKDDGSLNVLITKWEVSSNF